MMLQQELATLRAAEAAQPAAPAPDARALAEKLRAFAQMALEGQVEIRDIAHLERGLEHGREGARKRQTLIVTFVEL